MPKSFAIRKPVVVKKMQRAATPHTRGSLNRTIEAIADELAAITVIKHILAKGSRKGQIVFGIFPLLVSFKATPMIVGTTTIKRSEIIMPLMSIFTFAPIKRSRVAGTTSGASRVSKRINVSPSALSPLKIVTQIKPETAVGPANKRTKPVITSTLVKKNEEEERAANGIMIWLAIKKSAIGTGLFTAAPSSFIVSFNAPENVITPKKRITKGRSGIKTCGKNKPRATAKGVVTGMR